MPLPISELPKFLSDFGTGIVGILQETAEAVKARMSETGKPVTHPIEWDGEIDPVKHTTKQQRAFFASDGFSAGIPYHRIGAFEKSTTIEMQPFGAHLFSPHPAAAIIGFPAEGGWQSKIHRKTWNYLPRILSEEVGKIPDKLDNLYKVIGK